MLDEQIAANDGPACTCYSEDECSSVTNSTTSAPTTSTIVDNEPTQAATTVETFTTVSTPDNDIEPTDDFEPTTSLATTEKSATSLPAELTSEPLIEQTMEPTTGPTITTTAPTTTTINVPYRDHQPP